MATCDVTTCTKRVAWRAYASYNADHGENVHPLHARYPGPMVRACSDHLGELMGDDTDLPGSTRQWLVVFVERGGIQ
jgi:hypothetical protein